jgi:hypothetical protein
MVKGSWHQRGSRVRVAIDVGDARGPVNIVEPLVHGDGQDILLVVAQGSQSVQVGLNVEGAAGASHGEVADPQLTV